jgi:hypothetical protein
VLHPTRLPVKSRVGGFKKIDGNRKKSIEIDEKADGENGRQKNSKKIDF